MARGIPYAFHQRGRKNMRPPVQRDSKVYRDMSAVKEEEPKPKKVAAPKPAPKPKPVPPPPPKPEPVVLEEEPTVEPEPEPEMSMKNTKAEMLSVAEAMGLDVNEDMTKKQILAAINNA